jgi:CDP-glucose 4,6-dehydratase
MISNRPELGVFKDRSCLVTGHTGFKGSWLAFWLARLGAKVHGYGLGPATKPNLFELLDLAELIDDQRADIRDTEGFNRHLQRVQPEIVFHLAAQPQERRFYSDPRLTYDININGTLNVLEAVRKCPSVRSAVVVTSDKCYQNLERIHPYRETDRLGGRDAYSASKAAAELVCDAYRHSFFSPAGIGLATARAGIVIGGGDWAEDRIVPEAFRALQAGHPVAVRNPRAIRPWQHVLEPLFGYLAIGAQLFLHSGDPDALERLAGAWNFGPPTDSCRSAGALIDALLAAYGSGTWEEASAHDADAPIEARLLSLDWSKAYHGLGWRPRWDFDETVRRTCDWYRKLSEGYHARTLCIHEIAAYTEKV